MEILEPPAKMEVDLEELLDQSDLPEHPGVLRAIELMHQVQEVKLHERVEELKAQSKTWQREIELSDDFLRDLVMLESEAKTLEPLKDSIVQRLAKILVKSKQHRKRQLDRELEEEFEMESELLSRKQEKIDELECENNERNRVDLEKKRCRNVFEIEQTRVAKEIETLEQEFAFEVESQHKNLQQKRQEALLRIQEAQQNDLRTFQLLQEEHEKKKLEKQQRHEEESFERDDNHRKEKEYHQEQLEDAETAFKASQEVLNESILRDGRAEQDLNAHRALLNAVSEALVDAEQECSRAENELNNFRTERQKHYEDSIRWAREEYETWIQAIGVRREEVDAQLKTALEQLLQSQLDAIRPLDAKVSSVEDDKKKFEEEDKHDGERLARMRVTADEYLKKFEDLEKEREKLLEEYETKRYLSVKTAHLKEESQLNELREELARKKARHDMDAQNAKEEGEKLVILVEGQRKYMKDKAEKKWVDVQRQVDEENDELRKSVRETEELITQCDKDHERLLREQEEDLVPLRQGIEDLKEKEKEDKEAHAKAMEDAKEKKLALSNIRDERVKALATFEEESAAEQERRAKDIEDSGAKIERLLAEKHAAADSKFKLMRSEMLSMEKEELGNIAIEKRACELTLKDLEQFHVHETSRIDDLMTVVEDFEELVSRCQKQSDLEREQIDKEWQLALDANKKELEKAEDKMKTKFAGLKKAEDAARKALDAELGRLDQTVNHAKAEFTAKEKMVKGEISQRQKQVKEIDEEMQKIEDKERKLGEKKGLELSDRQISFLRPRTTEQIMSPSKSLNYTKGEVRGPVNQEHHAAAELCEKLKKFYTMNNHENQKTTVGPSVGKDTGAETEGEGEKSNAGGVDASGTAGAATTPEDGEEGGEIQGAFAFTREIERLGYEEDALQLEIELTHDAPATLNDCMNQGGRWSELSRRKIRLLADIQSKEEEIATDLEHVRRVESRIQRQKDLRVSALNEMLSIQLEELNDEQETVLSMVTKRRERLHASRKAYIVKYGKCAKMMESLSEECLPSLTHLRSYSNEVSVGMNDSERAAIVELRRVQILEKETEEHFKGKKDELDAMEVEAHEQCERDMILPKEHLERKKVDAYEFSQKVVEDRVEREKEIESLQDNLEKARLDMLDMEATRVDDEQKCLDAIADLGSKINNVFAIRKDHLKERLETKAKAQEQLPYFENNLAANEERILSEREQYEKSLRAAGVHREDDLKSIEVKKEEIEATWQAYSVAFEKDCDLAREQAKSAIASSQMTYEMEVNSDQVKQLVADAEEAKNLSERYRKDAATAAQTREHRRVLTHERWRRFLEACEKEKKDLELEGAEDEKRLKDEYDGYFNDLEEEEIAAKAELEANEKKTKEENHLRYKEERELETLLGKLNEKARETKNKKHQQEREILSKEKTLANAREEKAASEKKNTDCDLDFKRCTNLLERLDARILKEVQEHESVLLKERTDFEAELNLALETARLEADERLRKMQTDSEEEDARLAKEMENLIEKRKIKLEGDKRELQEEVRLAREELEKDVIEVDKKSVQRMGDREKEVVMAVEKRKLEREHNQRKFNEIELKYDAFLDNSIADAEAYFDLLGERLESHGQNVLKQTKLERKRAEVLLRDRMNKQLEDGQKQVQVQLEENRRKMQEETQKLIAQAEEDLWTRLKEERSSRLALIDQKRSQMKKEMEEEYISAQVKIREDLAQAEREKIDNVLSVFGPDTVKRGELASMKLMGEKPAKMPKVKAETEAFEKERKELIKEMAIMDLELQELQEYEK